MLSIIINVKNGEKYLDRCLASLEKFDDIVLLDNYSTDKTIEITKNYPKVRVFQDEFTGMGNVRNMATRYAQNNWVFFVDCDEIVSTELADTLLNTQFVNGCVYRVCRQNFYDHKYITTSSWEKDWILRLYNRTETKFARNQVHDNFEPNQLKEVKLQGGYLYHFPYDNINQLIDKMQFYSTLYAKQHFGHKKVRLSLLPFRAFMMFIKCYVLKRGFRDGYEGFIISCYNAMGVMSKYLKLYELGHKREIILVIKITSKDNIPELIKLVNNQLQLPHAVHLVFSDDQNALDNQQLFKHNLIVKHQVLIDSDATMNADNDITVKMILENNQILKDSKLIKICKKKLLQGKKHPQVRFVTMVK